MIIPKNLINEIVAVRTTGGEEIVGKLVEETATTITLGKPIIVHLQMMQQQGAAIAFAPFSLARDDSANFTLRIDALLTLPAKARDDIRTNYLQATTGLEIPSKGASSIIKP